MKIKCLFVILLVNLSYPIFSMKESSLQKISYKFSIPISSINNFLSHLHNIHIQNSDCSFFDYLKLIKYKFKLSNLDLQEVLNNINEELPPLLLQAMQLINNHSDANKKAF